MIAIYGKDSHKIYNFDYNLSKLQIYSDHSISNETVLLNFSSECLLYTTLITELLELLITVNSIIILNSRFGRQLLMMSIV